MARGEFSVEIGPDLRRVFYRQRRDKSMFPPKGLTQDQVAKAVQIATVTYRKIESGYMTSTSLATATELCRFLKLPPPVLQTMGYDTIAEELLSGDHNGSSGSLRVQIDMTDAKERLTAEEQEALLGILRKLGQDEPFGREIWKQ